MDDGAKLVVDQLPQLDPWYTTLWGMCFLGTVLSLLVAAVVILISYKRRP